MSKIDILRKAGSLIGAALKSPGAQDLGQRVFLRTGLDATKKGAEKVVTLVKKDPLLAGFILYELGSAGAEVLDELKQADPKVAEALSTLEELAHETTEVDEDSPLSTVLQLGDEFADIRTAIRLCGSESRFFALRRALTYSDDIIKAYGQVRAVTGAFS